MENIYHRGKIYRIVCNTTGKTYYGSTCEPTLAKRLAHHKGVYNHWKKYKKTSYCSSFEIIENNNYEMILCESVKCESKDELRMCERKWIENNECVNIQIPITTYTEKLEDARKYHHDNKELKNEQRRAHYLANREEGLLYRRQNYQDNRERYLEYRKKYREENIVRIREARTIKTICECGCEVKKEYLSRHKQSQKHIKLMENK